MAYNSNSSTQMSLLLLFTLSLLFSSFAASSSPLIQQACSKWVEPNLCNQVLESEPRIRSATNPLDLCTSIIESGISHATTVHSHIQDLLKAKTGPMEALGHCQSGYSSILVSFTSADNEVKGKELDTASYDLYASGDGLQLCQDAVASGKIADQIILDGNKNGGVFRISAINVVDSLRKKAD